MTKLIVNNIILLFLILISQKALPQLANSPWPMRGHDARHTGQSQYKGAQNPSLKWKYSSFYVRVSSPAIGSDGTIYIGSLDKYLYAINPDGTLKWKAQTGGLISSSPSISSNGVIYVGSFDYNLYAVNLTGTIKWNFYTGERYVESSPVIGLDGTIYIGSADSCLYSINPDGSLKWKYQTNGWVSSSPTINSDGIVYVGSNDSCLYSINPNGTLKWKFKTGNSVSSSPAIGSDGTAYVGSNDSYLYSINPDGSLKWKYQTDGWVSFSPAIDSDGIVYVGSNDSLYSINPNGTLKWKCKTDHYISSSPVIGSDNLVYIGCGNTLYAFETDSLPPSSIRDLSVINILSSSILLSWTSPGDDGTKGTASKYDIRYSTVEINNSNWSSATKVYSPPTPQYAGNNQRYTMDNLSPNSTYYIAIKTADDGNNWSELSNVVSAITSDSMGNSTWSIKSVDSGLIIGTASLTLDANSKPHIAYSGNNNIYYAKYDGTSWKSENVESNIYVGSISITVGSNNRLHIIYQTGNNLKYAFFDGTSWQRQVILSDRGTECSSVIIDHNGNPRFSYYDLTDQKLKYAYYDGSVWHFQMVGTGSAGRFPSLFLDKNDNPHISFYDDAIKYAFYNGSSWKIYQVESVKVNSRSSITVDNNGQPHIVYSTYEYTCDFSGGDYCAITGPTLNNLKYAYYNGTSWSVENLESITESSAYIFMDPTGNPYIVYYKGDRECIDNVPFLGCIKTAVYMKSTKYAYKQGGYWRKGTLYNGIMTGLYAMDKKGNIHYCSTSDRSVKYNLIVGTSWQQAQIVRSQLRVGGYNSIALDGSSNPHISYYDETNSDLKYSKFNGTSWQTLTIDTTGNAGIYTNIALDNNNNPHISYFLTTGPLKYAWFDGYIWHIETSPNKGTYGSMVLDKNSHPHISYFYNSNLIHTYFDGSKWYTDTLNLNKKISQTYSSIVLDANEHPHISFIANDKLMYSKFDGIKWQFIQVDSNISGSNKTSIALDNQGNPHISYSSNNLLKYVSFDGISWKIQNVDEGSSSLLILDGHNIPHIVYLGSDGLRYTLYDNNQWHVYNLKINANQFSFALDKVGSPHISYYDSQNGSLKYIVNPILTKVEDEPVQSKTIPTSFELSQNYPNPFNPTTTIKYQLPKNSEVSLKIYNVLGQLVKTLVDEKQVAGYYTVQWDGKDEYGHSVASGVYLYCIRTLEYLKTCKMMLLR